MSLLDLLPGQFKRASSKDGGEYHGPCPLCGGTDRFHVWPEQGEHGSWWCRGCDKGGDAIQYLRDIEGMGYKAACARLGVEPQAAPAANQIQAQRQAQTFTPTQVAAPEDIWSTKAEVFVKYCQYQLLNNPAQLAWLAQRGIDAVQIAKYRLGFNPANAWRERTAWGLPVEIKPETGKPKKLWLPMGLVIPLLSSSQVLRLRIRRPDGDLRYFVVPGSSREPLLTRADAAAYVVVESELDAICLDSLAGDLVGVVAMGNDSAKPTASLFSVLAGAAHLSISLDSDAPRKNQATGRMESPGAHSSRWWISQFRQAERIPVIGGKDPGEAFKAGVDLRSWVLAGLPPRFHIGKIETTPPEKVQDQDQDGLVITLTDGREVHVVEDQAKWQDLTAQGLLVFSPSEMARLQAAIGAAPEDERQGMVNAVLDVKAALGGGCVRAGRTAV